VWNEGDPGRRHRRSRFSLRRFKGLGRIAGKLTPFARFIPGLGTVMDTVENARSMMPAGDGGFMYTDDEGDPLYGARGFEDEGDPGPKPKRGVPKRGGGGKPHGGRRKKKGGGPGLGEKLGGFAAGLAGAGLQQVGPIGTFLGQQTGIIPKDAGLPMLPGADPGTAMVPMGGMVPSAGGRHGHQAKPLRMVHRHLDAWTAKGTRTMNAANPRALRHALRRVEGFERIVKRMERAYPRLKRVHAHPAPHHHKKAR